MSEFTNFHSYTRLIRNQLHLPQYHLHRLHHHLLDPLAPKDCHFYFNQKYQVLHCPLNHDTHHLKTNLPPLWLLISSLECTSDWDLRCLFLQSLHVQRFVKNVYFPLQLNTFVRQQDFAQPHFFNTFCLILHQPSLDWHLYPIQDRLHVGYPWQSLVIDLIDNWLLDTIVFYHMFFTNYVENIAIILRLQAPSLKFMWGGAWRKLLAIKTYDKSGEEFYHLIEFAEKIEGGNFFY